MVDEPAPLVAAFAQHMLAIGAAEVDLYLDGPNPQAAELLAGTDGVRLTQADGRFWAAAGVGTRPLANTARQVVMARMAMRRAPADWLLHCDFDEYLRNPARILQELAETPDDVTHVSLRMGERVILGRQEGLFGGGFRRMHHGYDTLGPALHGDLAGFFHRGLSGHMMGKSFTRTGRGVRPTVHYAVPEGDPAEAPGLPGPYSPTVRLLHFDGMTPLHYATKIMRRVLDPRSNVPRPMAPGRTSQIAALRHAVGDPAALARFVVRMTHATPAQAALLRQHGLLDELPFRPRVDDRVGHLLTPHAIDRRLRARHRVMLETHVPALLDEARWGDLVAAAVASGEDEVGRPEL